MREKPQEDSSLENSQAPRYDPPFSEETSSSLWQACHEHSSSTGQAASGLANADTDEDLQSVDADDRPELECLPTILRDKRHRVFLVKDDTVDNFLKQDLNVDRLNKIHGYLWMAGRPLNARTLVTQKMMGYEIHLTEKADLHLLKYSSCILIKPLPEYLLSYWFWKRYLCKDKTVHQNACGLLLSYMWLICTPHDFRIANECYLLPSGMTWSQWKKLVADFCCHVDVNSLDQVNKRYHFGELRLGRINSIYRIRFFSSHFVRGYLYGYNRYVVFFQRNFAWILVIFVYFSLILSAMQVGVSVPPLNTSPAFTRASYGFVVFSTCTAIFFLGVPGVVFVGVFLFNMVASITHFRRAILERARLAEKRLHRSQGA